MLVIIQFIVDKGLKSKWSKTFALLEFVYKLICLVWVYVRQLFQIGSMGSLPRHTNKSHIQGTLNLLMCANSSTKHLHCPILHCSELRCNMLHCNELHFSALHCTLLHCNALNNNSLDALHCITNVNFIIIFSFQLFIYTFSLSVHKFGLIHFFLL